MQREMGSGVISCAQAKEYGVVIGIESSRSNSYCCVGLQRKGQVEIIANDRGNRITPSWKGKPSITLKHKGLDRNFTPEEISAMVLSKMKEIAEAYLDFNDAQRHATKDAGSIAGLNVLRVIDEPTAISIAYGLNKKKGEPQIINYDLGGGTFDVSLLPIDDSVFEVLATVGDTHLGGEDFDNRVMDCLIKSYKKTGTDVTKNLRALGKLKHEVQKVNRTLWNSTWTLKPVEQVLKDANVKEDVDKVVFVGGSTRIPNVQQLKDYIRKESSKGINPDEAIAMLSLLVTKTTGGVLKLIPCSTVIPTRKGQIANGILKISAADKGTGKSESFTIKNEGMSSARRNWAHGRWGWQFATEGEAQCKRTEVLNSLLSFI
ncbi:heat shock protein 70 [Amanita rubescens]|nr:heat shock protein 70 [Amanita rubescens]